MVARGHETGSGDEALRARLSAREPAVRKGAAQEAGERRVTAVAPRLVELLHDGNSGVAATAVWALGLLRYTPAESDLAALLSAPGVALRKGAARALGLLGTPGARDRLLDALAAADEPTARSILLALDGFADDAVVPELVARLRDPSGPARARVGRALLRRPDAVVPALLSALDGAPADDDDDASTRFRRAAAHVLAAAATRAAATPATLPALLDLSRAADPRTRLYATRGLGALAASARAATAPEARARLQELAADERRDVAAAARAALGQEGQDGSGDTAAVDTGDAQEAEGGRARLPLDLAPNLTYLLAVLPGLEEIAAGEVGALPGVQVTRQLPGALLVTLDGPPAALAGLRTVLDAVLFAGRLPAEGTTGGRFRDRRAVRKAIAAIKDAYPGLPPTVYVHVPRGTRGAAAAALRAAARADLEHAGARVEPAEAALTAEVVTVGDERMLGIRVLPEPPGHRPLPCGGVPASLAASLAAALVRLTAPAPDDVFLDPLCGAGTLVRERAQAGPYARLLAGDADAGAVALARCNLQGSANVTVEQWDATHLPLDDASIDKAALNPPYGRRAGSHATNRDLYPALLAELARVLRPGGLVALVTAEQRLTTALLREQRHFARARMLPIRAGGLAVMVYLLRRR